MAEATPDSKEKTPTADAAASLKTPEVKARSGAGAKFDHYFRGASIDADSADDEDRTVQVAFSSETPVLRKATERDEKLGIAKQGEKYWEVLSHRKQDADFSELDGGKGAVLLEHKDELQIGTVKRAKISKDKVGRAVLHLDGFSDLSKSTFEQMKNNQRSGISVGYWHTGLVADDGEKDGYPVKRVAWGADEITSTRRPADEERSGVRRSRMFRSADGKWACLSCGDLFNRVQLDEDYECGCQNERSASVEKLKRTASEILPPADYSRVFRAKKSDGSEMEFSHSDLRQQVNIAADSHKQFKTKAKNGNVYSNFYVHDILQKGGELSAVIVGEGGSIYNVPFTLENEKVIMGDAQEVQHKSTFEPVNRSAVVDSPKLATADTSARSAQNTTKTFMPDNIATVIDEKKLRSDLTAELTPTITATVTSEVRGKVKNDLLARNKKITERTDAFIKDHGMKQRGKMAETLRSVANEFLTRDHGDAADAQVMAEFGQRALEEISKVQPEPYLLRSKTSEKEYAGYSMLRGIQSCVSGESRIPKDGFEREIHDDMIRSAKEFGGILGSTTDAGGFWVPQDAPTPAYHAHRSRDGRVNRSRMVGDRFKRDLYTGDFGAGGSLVPTELMTPIIEPLRNWTALDKVNVRFLGGLSGNIVIPRQTGVVTPQAVSEIGALALSQPTFDQISARPRRIGNQTQYSKQLIFQASPDVEAIIRDDNFKQIALLCDEYGLNGSGASSQPLGVMNQPGVFSIVFGATPTITKLESMATKIRAANIREPLAFLTTSNTRGSLRSAAAALSNSTTVISGQQNAIWTGTDDMGDVTGRPAFDSQQIPNEQVLLGAWDNLIWFQWAGVEVVVDPYTKAGTGEWLITMNTYNDFAVRHPQAFCYSADAGNQ